MYDTFKIKILPIIWSLTLIVVLLLTVIDWRAFNRAYYKEIYSENKTAETLDMSEADLELATDVLLSYLKGDNDSLDVEVEISGSTAEMFNQKEKDHMVDVVVLYQKAMMVRNISLILFLISSVWLMVTLKKEAGYFLYRSYQKSLLVVGLILLMLILYAVLDFTSFWNTFHHIFFSNDLWILDPRTDRLINMVPENFFSGLVFQIVTITVSSLVLIYGGLWFWKKQSSQS